MQASGSSAQPRVFVSYSRRDASFTDQLERMLVARGIMPAIDRADIFLFEDWWARIQELILKADTIVFVLSPSSVSSDVCKKEVAFAAGLGKRFAPVVCQPVDPAVVPGELARLNFLSFVEQDRWEGSADQLREAILTDISWIRKHTELVGMAQRWSAAGRPGPRGLLLRSPVLEEAERWLASRPAEAPRPTEVTQAFVLESRRATTRRRNILSAGLSAGLVVALILAGFAYWQRAVAVGQRERADNERERAEANLAAAQLRQSRSLTDAANLDSAVHDTATAALLAIEALPDTRSNASRPYFPDAELALFGAWENLRETAVLGGHQDIVWNAAFSPDGRRIVSASGDGTARLWDLQTGNSKLVLTDGTRSMADAAFSSDGQRIVTRSSGDGGVARVWSVQTGTPITTLRCDTLAADEAALSPSGRRFVIVCNKTARLVDVETGTLVAKLEGHDGTITSAAFSSDGTQLVTASEDKTARVWRVDTGQLISVLRGHEGVVNAAVFSRDGQHVATASDDGTAKVWNATTGDLIATLRGHLDPLVSVTFDPNDGSVLTASRDGTARLWDAATGAALTVLEGHREWVTTATFSPDGRTVLTASKDGTARLWDARAGTTLAVLGGHTGPIESARFSPDGRRIVTASDDGTVRLWDAAGGGRVTVLRGHNAAVSSVAFDASGHFLLSTSREGATAGVWDVKTKGATANLGGFGKKVWKISFVANGTQILTSGQDEKARLWDVANHRPILTLADTNDAVASPDGKIIAAHIEGDAYYLFDVAARKTIAVLAGSKDAAFGGVAFSPDGRLVMTAGGSIWDARTGALIATIELPNCNIKDILFSPDGRRVALSCQLGSVRLADIGLHKEIARLNGHTKSVGTMAFDPSGRLIVTASLDGTVRVWSVETGAPISTLSGHTDNVRTVKFSPDGRRILTASADRTARVWDAETGRSIALLEGHAADVSDIAMSVDGTLVATASDDETLRLWRSFPATQNLVDTAKEAAPRCLTREQRLKAFLDAEPPEWCVELGKWPYQSRDWKDWLAYRRAGDNPPLPDDFRWVGWTTGRKKALSGPPH